MARHRKGSAAAVWRERFRRFELAGVSVRVFCAREAVSEASFYQWRRRLGVARRTSAPALPAFQEVRLTAVGVLSIALPGGVRVEVPADQIELARLLVRELAEAARAGGSGGA